MNEPLEEFEGRLTALRPRDVSANAKAAIGERLIGRKLRTAVGLFGLAAAASLTGVVVWRYASPLELAPLDGVVVTPATSEHERRSTLPPPTLHTYGIALRESPEVFEDLLDRHSQSVSRPSGRRFPRALDKPWDIFNDLGPEAYQ